MINLHMPHMPRWALLAFLGLTLGLGGLYVYEQKAPESLTSRVAKSIDGVVLIQADMSKTDPATGKVQKGTAFGTGFFVGENRILTNYHVIREGENKVILGRGNLKKYTLELVAGDEIADVAIVKVKDSEWDSFKKNINYKILSLETSDHLAPGEVVYSIGHPWGFDWTVSQGIISAVDRRMGQTPQYFIQTDAKIYNGNSGGPLIDEHGNVVGMNTEMIINPGGSFGFALPGELLQKVIRNLESTSGKVLWPTIGIGIDVNTEGKVFITSVLPDKAGSKAGLMAGDVLLNAAGENIQSPDELLNILAIHDMADIIDIKVNRANVIKNIPVTLGGKPSSDFPSPNRGPE